MKSSSIRTPGAQQKALDKIRREYRTLGSPPPASTARVDAGSNDKPGKRSFSSHFTSPEWLRARASKRERAASSADWPMNANWDSQRRLLDKAGAAAQLAEWAKLWEGKGNSFDKPGAGGEFARQSFEGVEGAKQGKTEHRDVQARRLYAFAMIEKAKGPKSELTDAQINAQLDRAAEILMNVPPAGTRSVLDLRDGRVLNPDANLPMTTKERERDAEMAPAASPTTTASATSNVSPPVGGQTASTSNQAPPALRPLPPVPTQQVAAGGSLEDQLKAKLAERKKKANATLQANPVNPPQPVLHKQPPPQASASGPTPNAGPAAANGPASNTNKAMPTQLTTVLAKQKEKIDNAASQSGPPTGNEIVSTANKASPGVGFPSSLKLNTDNPPAATAQDDTGLPSMDELLNAVLSDDSAAQGNSGPSPLKLSTDNPPVATAQAPVELPKTSLAPQPTAAPEQQQSSQDEQLADLDKLLAAAKRPVDSTKTGAAQGAPSTQPTTAPNTPSVDGQDVDDLKQQVVASKMAASQQPGPALTSQSADDVGQKVVGLVAMAPGAPPPVPLPTAPPLSTKTPTPVAPVSTDKGRVSLLDDIRKGKELKKVAKPQEIETSSGGTLGVLKKVNLGTGEETQGDSEPGDLNDDEWDALPPDAQATKLAEDAEKAKKAEALKVAEETKKAEEAKKAEAPKVAEETKKTEEAAKQPPLAKANTVQDALNARLTKIRAGVDDLDAPELWDDTE